MLNSTHEPTAESKSSNTLALEKLKAQLPMYFKQNDSNKKLFERRDQNGSSPEKEKLPTSRPSSKRRLKKLLDSYKKEQKTEKRRQK